MGFPIRSEENISTFEFFTFLGQSGERNTKLYNVLNLSNVKISVNGFNAYCTSL